MTTPRYDSRAWTGDSTSAAVVKREELPRPPSPVRTGLACATFVAIIGFVGFKLACSMLFAVTNDMLVDAPARVLALAIVPLACSSAIRVPFVLRKYEGVPTVRRLDILVEPASAALLAIAFAIGGAISHHDAAFDPPERAQIGSIHRQRMQTVSTIKLSDGVSVTTTDYPAAEPVPFGRCLVVRRLAGSYGFRWLKIIDASPLPGGNRLATLIEPADCFSQKPLINLSYR